jgi:hypothetical protein
VAHTHRTSGGAVTWAGLAPVAQLDRAGGFYPSGCAFESCRGRHTPPASVFGMPCGRDAEPRSPLDLGAGPGTDRSKAGPGESRTPVTCPSLSRSNFVDLTGDDRRQWTMDGSRAGVDAAPLSACVCRQ